VDDSEENQLKVHIDEVAIAAVPTPIEGSCPWHWAPRCEWNSFIYELDGFSLASNGRIPASIAVSRQGYTTLLPLSQSFGGRRTGLSICVPPLYWFADWLRLIEFLETWRVLDASHFYVYFQSVSSVVHAVLRDYEKRGIVTLIRWQETPSSTEENPNLSVYRLGHSLAHNDCLMRTTSNYVALVDVDEMIYVAGTKNLLPFLDAQLNLAPLAGSFRFQHYRVHFPQREIPHDATLDWRSMDFSWIPEAKAVSGEGPTKAIFIADRTQITLTHRVLRHREPFQEIM
ncbi:Protein C18G1.7, partial [Aphelenchoides avenae]